MTTFLIIGAGQAAYAAINELERLEFSGQIVLVGEEAHLPYERPPLSKDVLLNSPQLEELLFKTAEHYSNLNIEVLLKTQVTALDALNKNATLSNGVVINFDKCLIATGASPRYLDELPSDSPFVHYFRTWDDAIRFKNILSPTTRLGIIGAGFLGLELASSAKEKGCQVHVFERSDRLLPRHAPSVLSDWLNTQALAKDILIHKQVSELTPKLKSNGVEITLNGTQTLEFDHVAVTIGSIPTDTLAKTADIATHPQQGGIIVDDCGKTNMPDIFAAGDCAIHVDKNNQALRYESWQNANEQGRRAASMMVGLEPVEAAFPWFWTDVFGSNIQMYGQYDPILTYLTRSMSDSADTKAVIVGIKNNVICHAIAINAARDLRPLKPLIERQIPINIEHFTDPSMSFREVAKKATLEQTQVNN